MFLGSSRMSGTAVSREKVTMVSKAETTPVCVGGGEGGVGVDKEGSEAEIRVWQPRPNVSGLKACYWLVLGAQSCRQLR